MHKTHRNSQNCRNTIAKKQQEKKRFKNRTLDGFLCPRLAFIASTVQHIPLIHSLPVPGECTSTALPLAVVSGPKESELLSRIQKIVKNLPDSVPIASLNLNKRPETGFAMLVYPRGEESTCAVD